MVEKGEEFTVALWHGGGGKNIPFAGVGTTTISDPAQPTKTIEDGINGDGGEITSYSYILDRTEIRRLSVARTCNRLRINVGADNLRMNVFTSATFLRVERREGAKKLFKHPMSDLASFDVTAVDDLGFIDVRIGGFSGGSEKCFSYAPFTCPKESGAVPACTLSYDGRTDGNFLPSENTFLAARNTQGLLASGFNKIIDGIGADIRVQFPMPARHCYPFFRVGTMTTGRRPPSEANVIDISAGRTDLNIVMKRSHADTVAMYATLLVEVGLVKIVADATNPSPTSYIAVEADNVVRAVLSPQCSPLILQTSVLQQSLVKGYAQLRLIFASSTQGSSKCTVTVDALPGSGVCATADACKTTFQITVSSVIATKWFWVNPSVLDNAPGLPAGPYFAAMGRSSTFRIGLFGKVNATYDIPVANCDE